MAISPMLTLPLEMMATFILQHSMAANLIMVPLLKLVQMELSLLFIVLRALMMVLTYIPKKIGIMS